MLDSLALLTGLDDFAILQIIALSAVCGFMVSQVLDTWSGSILCNIGLFACALAANLVCRKLGLIITFNKQLDGVLFSTLGLILGTVGSVMTVLLLSQFNNRVGTSAQKMRANAEAIEAAKSIR